MTTIQLLFPFRRLLLGLTLAGVTVAGAARDIPREAVASSGSALISPASAGAGEVVSFGGSHISAASQRYRVRVNGQEVFVHYMDNGTNEGDEHYVHFAFTGTAQIEVTCSDAIDAATTRLSPLSYAIPCEIAGHEMRFTIDRPRHLILAVNSPPTSQQFARKKHLLLIYAEAPETDVPQPDGPGVTAVNGNTAEAIRQAIAACAPGGTVYFRSGKYVLDSTVEVDRDNLTLYFAPGAYVTRDAKVPLRILGRKNVTLRGRGVIESKSVHMNVGNVDNFLIEGLILRNSLYNKKDTGFFFCLFNARNSTIRNVKTVGLPAGPDGKGMRSAFVINNGRDILIENCLTQSHEDNICLKAFEWDGFNAGPPVEMRNIVVRNCVIYTLSAGLKIGTEVARDVHDVTFENCDIVNGTVSFFCRESQVRYEGITVRNVRIENSQRGFLDVCNFDQTQPYKNALDLTVENMIVDTVYPGVERWGGLVVTGADEGGRDRIQVRLRNLTVAGRPIRSLADLHAQGLNRCRIVNADVRFEEGSAGRVPRN